MFLNKVNLIKNINNYPTNEGHTFPDFAMPGFIYHYITNKFNEIVLPAGAAAIRFWAGPLRTISWIL
jgi:hypothetical protein